MGTRALDLRRLCVSTPSDPRISEGKRWRLSGAVPGGVVMRRVCHTRQVPGKRFPRNTLVAQTNQYSSGHGSFDEGVRWPFPQAS
jgi:hypothetical protein